MTAEYTYCKNCHNPIIDARDDAVFCGPNCKAAFARNEGYHRERFHAERPEMKEKPCEHCGTPFFYNEYAERGGQRVAQYCSNRCRQAAFRARKKESPFDGGANRWQDARSDKTQRKGTSQSSEKEKQDYQDKRHAEDARSRKRADDTYKGTSHKKSENKGTSQSADWWKSRDAYTVLGVTYLSTKAQIKKAWMGLIRQYHPDVCKEPSATEISQAVNAAYDKLKGK